MTKKSEAPRSDARARLLATAAQIFYREGIHAVGVDRLVSEAGVTRATFYRHFPSKDDLVRAYIELEDRALRDLFAASAAHVSSPEDALEVVLQGIAQDVQEHHTRGCPFLNAAAEFPDPQHPVRRAVRVHRDWFAQTLSELVGATGREDAAQVARALVLLRDSALVGAYVDGSADVVPAFLWTAHQIIGEPQHGAGR
ncbi:hypothetical protein AZH51_00305 [Branchiibius sp. NY16-3462-2]|nr:hypothetical protein AZH51_00305 [Branchiibius sp. NY16-3462-2]